MKLIKNKKAFTMVELLTVIVIIAIIAGISIPAVTGIYNKQQNKKYMYHQNMVEQAAKLYIEKYDQNFDENSNCFNIPYQFLIDESLLKEEIITCSPKEDPVLGGNIQITRTEANKNNYTYRYFYKCKTTNNNKIVYDGGKNNAGCAGVNGDFIITDVILKYNNESGNAYPQTANNWTTQNIFIQVTSNDPYMAGIKGMELSSDGGENWNYISGTTFTYTEEFNKDVQVRVVDNDGNKSGVKIFTIRIDRTAPKVEYNIGGGILNKETVLKVTAEDLNFSYMMVHTYKDGVKQEKLSTDRTSSNNYEININQEGQYKIFTKAFDLAGNSQRKNPEDEKGWYYQNYDASFIITKYRARIWNAQCSYISQGYWNFVDRWIYCDSYPRCDETGYQICSIAGTFHVGACSNYQRQCRTGNCGDYTEKERYSWINTSYWQGCWGEWGSWDTTVCTAGPACEIEQCRSDSPIGLCNK